ncbi:hypothetical protein DUNSADRAFT_10398 [Dunaliella salina]|uniref:Pentatricopeptide repeat-containing protein n=1 Tax=Dunaliella salina TaxID=3046 RepID=A0ABQ7GFH6_DUNSA|nr:hypothetical protein DUNSADRAFT_10398 [Dunaliella salina]|eukprot:KAF5833357.1 hypothetical protein DUNSADRAFT_10398 [Dunaliella salina]
MEKNDIERASELRFRASCLSERILRHVADSEARVRQVERYNWKPAPVQGKGAVVAVLQDEALDELTASYLIAALGYTSSAGLAIVAADWLADARPKLGNSPVVLDAALRVASTATFGPDAALRFFHRRRSAGLPPAVFAANAVITACSHCGDSRRALEILEGMVRDGLVPNEFSLVMALQATNYKCRGLHKEAMRVVATWPHGPLLPSSVVDLLLAVFEAALMKAPSLEAAEQVFQDLKSIGFHDTTRAYNAILGLCARFGDWGHARTIFEGMVAEDVPADARTFNALLKACVKGGSLQAALDIYEWLVAGRDVHSPVPADIETYNILIRACHQAGYLEKALEIWNWAMAAGMEFNSETYRELMETIEVAQIWDQKALKGIRSGDFSEGPFHNQHSHPQSRSPSRPQSRTPSMSNLSASPSVSPRLPNGEPLAPSPRNKRVSLASLPPPLAILPHHLRPAPHDGLRVLYLDHLEDLQDEALLAASKLKSSSWANTLMQGGHSSAGKGLPPVSNSTSVTAAMAGSGIFSSAFNKSWQRSPRSSQPTTTAASAMTPIALSRMPSRLGHHA